jgi:hypothetical protein
LPLVIVVSRDFVDPFWLDQGKMPDDAWEKTHGAEMDNDHQPE